VEEQVFKNHLKSNKALLNMKNFHKNLLLLLFVAGLGFASCSKDNTTSPAKKASALSPLNGSWYISGYGGNANTNLTFSIDTVAATGTVTQITGQAYGLAIGDKFFTNIIYNAPGRYNATAEYTYGTNNTTKGTRAAILTLQNNNTQLSVEYPALNADFPDITYIFRQGSVTNVNL
jgi:hypothetical protein